MGGGKGGGGGNDEARKAREAEEERQKRIRQGTQRINSIFDGGRVPVGGVGSGAAFDPNATYFMDDGSVWRPDPGPAPAGGNARPTSNIDLAFGGIPVPGQNDSAPNAPSFGWPAQIAGIGGQSQPLTPQQQFDKLAREGKLFTGMEQRGGFDDDFFNQRRQSYIDYANPQLEDQYGDAQKELTFALTRGGLLDSSVRGEKAADLQQLYDLNKQQIADQALAHENEARNAVEDARSNLIATLNATGDAQGAANQALSRATALSQPAAYSPLAQLFSEFTAGLGTQAALERANQYSGGQTGARYDTGLFAPNPRSVQVT